jgi:hypothetical protein
VLKIRKHLLDKQEINYMKKQSTTNYTVSGRVINQQKQSFAALTVQAFNQDSNGEIKLGKPAVTDEKD